MEHFAGKQIKWPYATHLVDRKLAARLLPPIQETRPGGLLLARVDTIGRHTALEGPGGRRVTLFPDDIFVAVLGNRYATAQFEGRAVCDGISGHILGMGGVCGQVVSSNTKMSEPTSVQWLGRLADHSGRPLELQMFRVDARSLANGSRQKVKVIVSVGASMNAGKTTTAAHLIRWYAQQDLKVGAAKITGTACRRDCNKFEDAGACQVLDFTHGGLPSTAGCRPEELIGLADRLHRLLLSEEPAVVVYEIADGLTQRETRILLENNWFRSMVDAVVFSAPDALACESGARLLRESGLPIVATSGPVSASPLGISEAESLTGLPCLSLEMILQGRFADLLRETEAA